MRVVSRLVICIVGVVGGGHRILAFSALIVATAVGGAAAAAAAPPTREIIPAPDDIVITGQCALYVPHLRTAIGVNALDFASGARRPSLRPLGGMLRGAARRE